MGFHSQVQAARASTSLYFILLFLLFDNFLNFALMLEFQTPWTLANLKSVIAYLCYFLALGSVWFRLKKEVTVLCTILVG